VGLGEYQGILFIKILEKSPPWVYNIPFKSLCFGHYLERLRITKKSCVQGKQGGDLGLVGYFSSEHDAPINDFRQG
jgi:hypothetical protein